MEFSEIHPVFTWEFIDANNIKLSIFSSVYFSVWTQAFSAPVDTILNSPTEVLVCVDDLGILQRPYVSKQFPLLKFSPTILTLDAQEVCRKPIELIFKRTMMFPLNKGPLQLLPEDVWEFNDKDRMVMCLSDIEEEEIVVRHDRGATLIKRASNKNSPIRVENILFFINLIQ